MVVLVACKSRSETALKTAKVVAETITCPSDGVCALEVFKNKNLEVKADNFGQTYLEMVDGKRVVLKFEYKKDVNSKYEDSSYREEVFIELDAKAIEMETVDFKDKKVFFARWCFCKGQTGFYKINTGNLSISRLENTSYQMHLTFTVDEVPQIIKEIKQNFNLD